MGMNQDTLHRQQREGGTPEYLRFQKGPNVGYEARKEKERTAEQQQQQQQLHPSAMPRHSLSPQQSWESEMYAGQINSTKIVSILQILLILPSILQILSISRKFLGLLLLPRFTEIFFPAVESFQKSLYPSVPFPK